MSGSRSAAEKTVELVSECSRNMKFKTVSSIAALLCGILLSFIAAFAQENTMTAQTGDTFPKTPEEISLVEDLIVGAFLLDIVLLPAEALRVIIKEWF